MQPQVLKSNKLQRLRNSSSSRRGQPRGLCRSTNVSLPGGIDIPLPVDVDISALQTQAQELQNQATGYLNTVDTTYFENEVNDGIAEVQGIAGEQLIQLNETVIQPYWKETAPQLEAYFRQAWGDYYYDYFIDEWNSGVNDLERLYNFTTNTVIAGDWKRGLALLAATWYTPGFFVFLLSLNKGYRGNVDAIDAFQMVENEDATIVDVRLDSEKSVGVPDLPSRFKNNYLDVGYARDWLTPDVMKLSQDMKALETKATSTVVADLKRLNDKRQPVIVLDNRNDGRAISISQELTSTYKFRNVYVINGGFNSWKSNKLPHILPDGRRGTMKRGLFF
jgi:rhodanese-related sulfurtransferase